MKSSRGMSLLELVVAVAVFGVFLLILTSLASEYGRLDRQVMRGWFLHPDDMAVATRLRRDVLDSTGYPASFGTEEQSATTLLLWQPAARTIVWTFGEEAVRRDEWKGASRIATWSAKAPRKFEVESWDLPNGVTGVHLVGRSKEGGIVVDRIFAPRPE